MLDKLRNVFQVPELKRRILFTLALFVIYRLGEHMPTPGVNAKALAGAFASQQGTLFGLYDLFVGGAFSRATVFALGIMPYISSSIILQLLGAVVPYFEAALYRLSDAALTAEHVLALARETERHVLAIESPRPMLAIPHLLNQESAASYQGYLLAHQYEGLIRKSKLRGRRR